MSVKDVYIHRRVPIAIFEISPSQMTSNRDVKWMLVEFARLFKPLNERLEVIDYKSVIHTEEYTLWWEVAVTTTQIKFYLCLPDIEDIKMSLRRVLLKTWSRSNVIEVKEHFPVLHPATTSISRVVLQNHSVLSLDTTATNYTPLHGILNAKHYLQEGDTAILQIGLKPVGSGWNERASEIYDKIRTSGRVPRKKGSKLTIKEVLQGGIIGAGLVIEEVMNLLGDFIIPGWEEDRGLLESLKTHYGSIDSDSTRLKVKSEAFSVSINAIASCSDDKRRKSIIRAITMGYEPLAGDNRLIEMPVTKDLEKEIDRVSDRRFRLNTKDVLGHLELAKMIQVPDKAAQIEHYNELSVVTTRTESDIPKAIFDDHAGKGKPFGVYQDNDGQWKTTYFDPHPDSFCKGKIFIGASGSGKTTLAANMAIDNFLDGMGGMVVDAADGVLIDRILSCVPPSKKAKVKIIDFLDAEYAVGLGWNEAYYTQNKDIIGKAIVTEILAYVELVSGTELNMKARQWMENAVRAVYVTPDATLQDVELMLSNPEYRERIIPGIKDPELRYDWEMYHNSYSPEERASIYDQAYRRLAPVIRDPMLRKVLLQKPKKNPDGSYVVDFRKWMDEGYLVLVRANETLGDLQTPLVSFLISKFNIALISRDDIPEKDRKECFVLLDEPDHYIKGSQRWRYMFTRYRKYHGALMFMFHGWDLITGTDRHLPKVIREAGVHYFIFKTDEDTLLEMKALLEPTFKIRELVSGIPQHHAVVRLDMYADNNSGVREPVPPFMVKTLDIPEKRFKQYNNSDLYKTCSVELGRPGQEILEEIFRNKMGAEFSQGDIVSLVTTEVSSDGEGELIATNEPDPEEVLEDAKKLRRKLEYEVGNFISDQMAKGEEPDEDLIIEMDRILGEGDK